MRKTSGPSPLHAREEALVSAPLSRQLPAHVPASHETLAEAGTVSGDVSHDVSELGARAQAGGLHDGEEAVGNETGALLLNGDLGVCFRTAAGVANGSVSLRQRDLWVSLARLRCVCVCVCVCVFVCVCGGVF